jgi:hypothetical protein
MILTLSQVLQGNCQAPARCSAVPFWFDCGDLPKQVWQKETGLLFHLQLREASSERKKELLACSRLGHLCRNIIFLVNSYVEFLPNL